MPDSPSYEEPRPGYDVPRAAEPERSLTPARVSRLRRLTILLAVMVAAGALANWQQESEFRSASILSVVVSIVVIVVGYGAIWKILGSPKRKRAEGARTAGSILSVLAVTGLLLTGVLAITGASANGAVQLVVGLGSAIVGAIWLHAAWRRLPAEPTGLLD
ncbi:MULTISPECIES: hypothetical protein [unclassified Pseudoclavibacter]|jgi:hypothetical protein|uniref:hypothetical protein n=1 Tax=unclassified Pseudoclavibacter TaxID=2615177 RepID=UPI0011B0E848|nr:MULTISPECIES: hypothetical protein [unclassified Pseudoclavibacter]MBS3179924.1 hypothetical protein [Pseudoclavibacter sp. Marseille-Q4354]NYF12576.1 cell division septal protein FtsQ [Pseudoclavibacter sp. JAI123]